MPKPVTKEQIDEMKKLYLSGLSLRAVGKKLNLDHSAIKNNLIKNNVKIRDLSEPRICDVCGKTFIPTSYKQKYCYNPCEYRYGKGKDNALNYHYIKTIRCEFYRRIKDNPSKALQLEKDMIDEEGQEFTDMVLGDITKTADFDKAVKIYIKYKKVWDEG